MIFDQILTKLDQIFIIYVKNQLIHVEKFKEMSFSQNKQNNTPHDHPKLVIISIHININQLNDLKSNINELKIN